MIFKWSKGSSVSSSASMSSTYNFQRGLLKALVSRSSMKKMQTDIHYKASFLLHFSFEFETGRFGNILCMWHVTVRQMQFLSALSFFCTVCRATLMEGFVNSDPMSYLLPFSCWFLVQSVLNSYSDSFI